MQFRCPRNRKMVFFSFVLFVSVNETQSIRLSMSIWVLASCSVTPNPSPLRYCATMTCSLHYDVTHITRDISISHPHDNSFSYAMCTHTTTVTVIPLVIQSGEVDVEFLWATRKSDRLLINCMATPDAKTR